MTWVAAAHTQVYEGGSAGIIASASLLYVNAAFRLSIRIRWPARVYRTRAASSESASEPPGRARRG